MTRATQAAISPGWVLAEIRAEAARQDMNHSQLAARIGMSMQSFSKRIRGERDLSIAELLRIADALDVSPRQFLPDRPSPSR